MSCASATVFNIQKFSLDDGPGIRTVVFVKGCPLHCAWCANPESQSMKPQVEWDERACQRCGTCVAGSDAASFSRESADGEALEQPRVAIDHAKAADPDALAALCPHRALAVVGETRSLDDVVAECLKDKPFYEQSGGGVTISGGEVLLWCDFARALAARLHEEGVPVAVETTGFAAPETFERLVDVLDLVLMDVKHWDEAAHRAGVGVGRARIQANMAAVLASGHDVLFRTPVIPGYNDRAVDEAGMPLGSEPDFEAAADGFASVILSAWDEAQRLRKVAGLSELPAPRQQLLPFHQLGESKYAKLGRAYGLHEARALTHEELEPLAEALRARGVDAFV